MQQSCKAPTLNIVGLCYSCSVGISGDIQSQKEAWETGRWGWWGRGGGGTGGETLIVRDGGREGTNWEERENN